MNQLSPVGRLLAILSTIAFGWLIICCVFARSTTPWSEWVLLFLFWLVPAVGIAIVERKADRRSSRSKKAR